jgi:predicted metal-binding protein
VKALPKTPYKHLVLLCTNVRPPGSEKPSCGHHDATELRAWLKKQLKAHGVWGKGVRVATTGCLDLCPAQGVILSFDGGDSLVHACANDDRDEILARILAMVQS